MTHDWDAATYDRVSEPQVRWAVPVIERVDGEGLARLLDAGCGSGRVTEMLLERFPGVEIVAVDASASMVREARARLERFGKRVSVVEADLAHPLPDVGEFDTVFSTAVFHWIGDHAALFSNLAAVMSRGGRLVAQWGGGRNIESVIAALREVGDGWTGPWNFATVEETRARLLDAGFTDPDVWTHDDPADFESREALEEFMRTAILGAHLERIQPKQRDAFVRGVADRLPGNSIDYVRLNATASLR
jgi:trans-aconitate 2-methyltransferase